jgi:hypothetical protein
VAKYYGDSLAKAEAGLTLPASQVVPQPDPPVAGAPSSPAAASILDVTDSQKIPSLFNDSVPILA